MYPSRKVQIVAIVCLIPTALKDVALAIPEAVKEFKHDVKTEMDHRKKMIDMLYPMN